MGMGMRRTGTIFRRTGTIFRLKPEATLALLVKATLVLWELPA